mmetsp:Transcript_39144/g.100007  ORF Transcript_39144/g.100007 Transcript_39144/m.100007 type:complete len:251 (+) Transcript_39144:362-1114(+)
MTSFCTRLMNCLGCVNTACCLPFVSLLGFILSVAGHGIVLSAKAAFTPFVTALLSESHAAQLLEACFVPFLVTLAINTVVVIVSFFASSRMRRFYKGHTASVDARESCMGRDIERCERFVLCLSRLLWLLLWLTFISYLVVVVAFGVLTTMAMLARAAVSTGVESAFVQMLAACNLLSAGSAQHFEDNHQAFKDAVVGLHSGDIRLWLGSVIITVAQVALLVAMTRDYMHMKRMCKDAEKRGLMDHVANI